MLKPARGSLYVTVLLCIDFFGVFAAFIIIYQGVREHFNSTKTMSMT